MGVLLTLGVALTPALALLHSHHTPQAHADHAAGTGYTPHDSNGHTPHGGDHQPRGDDHAPADEGQGDCGLCYLVHQARADLCTPVPTPSAPARTGRCRQVLPNGPPLLRTALLDAPPRGPPAL